MISIRLPGLFALFSLLLIMISCSSSRKAVGPEIIFIQGHEYWNYRLEDHIDEDPQIQAMIGPYRSQIETELKQVLTISTGLIERDKPEGPLGNITSDILRNRATREMGETVHIAILNNGGLRVPLPAGPIKVIHIYELMPFENHIVVLKFTGDQILQLADEIAAAGGEPVSGFRFRISNGKAADVLVGNRPVQTGNTYWVATNNWLADGGGDMPTLWEPIERIDKQVLIRDAFIEYLKHISEIEPFTDSRIRR
jgi:2',3'-cyclic-nucleotide 2'-phosphodiesterase (5'-nucleotidase family)